MTTIADLELEERGPVFVLNTSQNIPACEGKQAVMPLNISNDGNERRIFIPQTYIPIDLTEQTTRKRLVESDAFRAAITKGAIRLISAAEAKKLLSGADAAAEQARVRAYSQSVTGAQQQDNQKMEDAIAQQTSAQGSRAEVLGIIYAIESGESDSTSVLNSMRNTYNWTVTEYRAVRTAAKNQGPSMKDVASFCRDQMVTLGVKFKKK